MSSIFLRKDDQNSLCKLFNDLLSYSVENFAYYKNHASIDYSRKITSLEELDSFPIQLRSELIDSQLVKEAIAKNPPTYFETSGTSGTPFPVLANLTTEKNQAFAAAIDSWQSLKKDKVTKALIALPFEMNPVGLKYYMGLMALGITAIPAGVRTLLCTPNKVLQIIERLKPELLIGRPLEILRYAEALQLDNQDPAISSIKKIIFTGEIVSENKWKRMRKIYGDVTVDGIYGLTELDSGGLISCTNHKYHLPPVPYLIVEVLKDDLKTPVTDGEMGTIIITNTEKTYLPLIRYNTGDKGILHTHCNCGMATPAIEVMGRDSDCIMTHAGEIYPIQIENILFSYPDIGSDYQILSKDNSITIRLEIKAASQSAANSLVEQVKAEIYSKLNLSVTIQSYSFGKLVDKLGIAKEKAGKLYVVDGLTPIEMNNKLQINYF